MNRIPVAFIALFASAALLSGAARTAEKPERVREVTALEMDITALLNTQAFIDHPEIALKYYGEDDATALYDIMLPGEFRGADFRKHFVDLGVQFVGKVDILGLEVHADDSVAFATYKQHYVGKTKDGKPFDVTLMVTDGLLRSAGGWRIEHEQATVAVDAATLATIFSHK
jgi:ketosteroid isomerase-like protein